ncbi:DJ-1/PfpI family protein [Devosia sp. Root635]|uniref:DJ-1/PfpI family protein n=1 Tax=Devosia sp. Root635 TaxID=1736575 RepID=UPI0006FAF679|nr:DJ-1/PfpI family protein [Devosia sp. Root635]KRA40300.1 transcriptional regulator [Devosia sp. Root635]
MKKRAMAGLGLLGVAVLALGGFGIWLATLPADIAASPAPLAAEEAAAVVDGLRPRLRERPVIAIIGINDATETTDYLMPAGILRRADIADVFLLATGAGAVKLYPALTVDPDMTIAAFDQAYPDGADYVIVPAMSRDDDPAVMDWLRRQAEKGSMVVAVCAGAKVVAAAGLLDGKRGTTHWFYLKELLREHPSITYVPDRRFVIDGKVATTTGITASMPIALTLIEAIAGRAKAQAVASEIGLDHWDGSHDSVAFRLSRPFATTVMGNVMQFWQREQLALPLEPGFDTVSLALVADAWSRTYRSRALTMAPAGEAVTGSDGIAVHPDTAAPEPGMAALTPPGLTRPVLALEAALDDIATRYGAPTAHVVAMQLEYPGR